MAKTTIVSDDLFGVIVRPLLSGATTDRTAIVTLAGGLYQIGTPDSVTVSIAAKSAAPRWMLFLLTISLRSRWVEPNRA